MANLTDMLSKFVTSNTASTSGSGTLPGNTITNPKEDLKGITTRSGVAYQGPAIPSGSSSSPKVMNRDTEVTKDTMLPANNGSTEDVQPPIVQVQSHNPISKPVVDPLRGPFKSLKPIGIISQRRPFHGGKGSQFPSDFVVVDFEPDPPSTFNSREEFLKDQSQIHGKSDATSTMTEGDILVLEALLMSEPFTKSTSRIIKIICPDNPERTQRCNDKLPVIIAQYLEDEENRQTLIKVLKSTNASHSLGNSPDIKGDDP
ncbi:hypothetical protein Tco_0355900 [Tanacetum coccineum]